MVRKILHLGVLFFLFGYITLFSFCKKDSTSSDPTSLSLQYDTVLAYTKDIYLWNDKLPTTYSINKTISFDSFMRYTRQYSIETGFSDPVDKWSFAIDKSTYDRIAVGENTNYGIYFYFVKTNALYIGFTDPNSPSGKAGIERGDSVVAINGITTTDYSVLSAAASQTSMTLKVKKTNGEIKEYPIQKNSYVSQPLFYSKLFDNYTKKFGYIVFNSFIGDTTNIKNSLTNVFNTFASTNIKDLIIDLRYNGGGYVTILEFFSNNIVPSNKNGQVMFTQKFNNNYSQYNTTTRFSKKSNLEIENLYIITSPNTASASEMLINVFKPILNLKLIGTATHGKPVGFFPIPVGDQYLFPVSIRSVNQVGSGNYFNGFIPDYTLSDDVTKNWGNEKELCLAKAIELITGINPNGTRNIAAENALREMQGVLMPINQKMYNLQTPPVTQNLILSPLKLKNK